MPPLQDNDTFNLICGKIPLNAKSYINVITAFDLFFMFIFIILDILFLFLDAPKNWTGTTKDENTTTNKNTRIHFILLSTIMFGNLCILIYTIWFRIKNTSPKNHQRKKCYFYLRAIWGFLIIVIVISLAIYDILGPGGKIWEWGIGVVESAWGFWAIFVSKKLILAWINTVRKDLDYYYN